MADEETQTTTKSKSKRASNPGPEPMVFSMGANEDGFKGFTDFLNGLFSSVGESEPEPEGETPPILSLLNEWADLNIRLGEAYHDLVEKAAPLMGTKYTLAQLAPIAAAQSMTGGTSPMAIKIRQHMADLDGIIGGIERFLQALDN